MMKKGGKILMASLSLLMLAGCGINVDSEQDKKPNDTNNQEAPEKTKIDYNDYIFKGSKLVKNHEEVVTINDKENSVRVIVSAVEKNQCYDYAKGEMTCYQLYLAVLVNNKLVKKDIDLGVYRDTTSYDYKIIKTNDNIALIHIYENMGYDPGERELIVFDLNGNILLTVTDTDYNYDGIDVFVFNEDGSIWVNATNCSEISIKGGEFRKKYEYKNGKYTKNYSKVPSDWSHSGDSC